MTTRGSGQRQASLPESWNYHQRTSSQLNKGQERKISFFWWPHQHSGGLCIFLCASTCVQSQQLQLISTANEIPWISCCIHLYRVQATPGVFEIGLIGLQWNINCYQHKCLAEMSAKSKCLASVKIKHRNEHLLNSLRILNSFWRYQAALSIHRRHESSLQVTLLSMSKTSLNA